jgi:hypothetical protein
MRNSGSGRNVKYSAAVALVVRTLRVVQHCVVGYMEQRR